MRTAAAEVGRMSFDRKRMLRMIAAVVPVVPVVPGGPGEPEWLSKLPNGPTPLQCASLGVSSRSARRPIDHPMPPDVE